MIKAGVAIADISPKKGVNLAGYPHCPRPNEGVHDPIYAACMYLNSQGKETVFITCDLLYVGKRHVSTLRKKFPQIDIMVTATHTHSGPWASHVIHDKSAKFDTEYNDFLQQTLQDLVQKAKDEQFEASVGIGSGSCGAEQGIGGNRRQKGGLADTSVNIIAVKDKENVLRGCLLNYSLHPTYLHAENHLVTADYPGYIRRYMGFAYPEAVFLFAQGTAGDQSSRYHRVAQDFEEAARAGTTLGVECYHTINRLKFTDKLDMSSISQQVELPFKNFPSEEDAQKLLKDAQDEFERRKGGDYIPYRNAELALFGAENQLTYSILSKDGFKSEELPCEVQIISLNDTKIISVQGELFVEYGLRIKELSPSKNTFVFTVTNGALPGYVYTPAAGAEGGYETGTSVFSHDAGEYLIEKIKEMLDV